MSAHPIADVRGTGRRQPTALPVTLPQLLEKKRLGEPIVMVTAYDYPSARAAEAAGVDLVLVGDSGAMTVLGYPTRPCRSRSTSCSMLAARRAPRPAHAVPGRRPAVRLLRGLRRAGDRDRAALRQGGRLRRRQARGRRPGVGRARPRDRQRRHPGDGPRRPDAADVDRARRLQGPGPHAPTRARAGRPRGARAPGGRLLRDRLRGDPERRRRRSSCRAWRSRSSASAPARRPTARCSCSTTCSASARASGARFVKRYADLQDEMAAGVAAYADDVRTRALPGARARLLDRRGRARDVPRGGRTLNCKAT